jgi:hypothetical protein
VDLHGLTTTFKTWTNDKTHHAWQAIEAALAHSIGNKVESDLTSSRNGGR